MGQNAPMWCVLLIGWLSILAAPAAGCGLALVLAVDVSGSVDDREYRIQMQGLAEGLRDGAVSEALVAAEAAVTVLHWTGSGRQETVVPWTRIAGFDVLESMAKQIGAAPRRWRNYSTAIGEALLVSAARLAQQPGCLRRVIDISGDGTSNEGIAPRDVRGRLQAAGIVVNALVIEGAEPRLTEYFHENVIAGPGAFVITANGYKDYPVRMRLKLRREVVRQLSAVDMAKRHPPM